MIKRLLKFIVTLFKQSKFIPKKLDYKNPVFTHFLDEDTFINSKFKPAYFDEFLKPYTKNKKI